MKTYITIESENIAQLLTCIVQLDKKILDYAIQRHLKPQEYFPEAEVNFEFADEQSKVAATISKN